MSSNKSKAKPQTVEDESPTPSQAGEEGVLTVTTLAELNEAIDLGEDLIACDMTLKPTRQVFPCTAEDAPKHPYVYVLFNPNDQGIPPEFYRGHILSYDADKKTHKVKFYDNDKIDYDLTGEAVIWGPSQLTVGGLPFYNKKEGEFETKLQDRRPRWPTIEEASAAASAGGSKKRKEPHAPTEEQQQEPGGGKEKTANTPAGTAEQPNLGCSKCRYSAKACKACRNRPVNDKSVNKRAKPTINAPQKKQQRARPSSVVVPPPPPPPRAAAAPAPAPAPPVVDEQKQQEKVQKDVEMKEASPLPTTTEQQKQLPPSAAATVQPGPGEPVIPKQHQQQAAKPPPVPPVVAAAVPAGKAHFTAPPPQPQPRPRSAETLPTTVPPSAAAAAVADKKELRKDLLTKKGDKPAMKKPDDRQERVVPPPPGAVKPDEPSKVETAAAAAATLAPVQSPPPPPPPRLDPKVKEVSDALQQATAAFTELGAAMKVLKEKLAAATAAATALEQVNIKVYGANVVKGVPDLPRKVLDLKAALNEVFNIGEYKHQYQQYQQAGPAGGSTKRPEMIFQDTPVLCGKAVARTHTHLKELLKKGLYAQRNIDKVNLPAVSSWGKAQKQAEEDVKKEAMKKQAEQQQQKQQQQQQQQQQQPPPTFEEMKNFRMFDSRGDEDRDDAIRILAHGFCGRETPMSAALEMERSMYTALREPDGTCGIVYNRMLHTIWSKIARSCEGGYKPLVRWAVLEDVITPNELPRMTIEDVYKRVKEWVGEEVKTLVVGELEQQQQQLLQEAQQRQQQQQGEQEPKRQ